jgi:hypothetical protein
MLETFCKKICIGNLYENVFLVKHKQVEMQAFGPYKAGTQQVYVVVALDSYSQFPEATVIGALSAANVTNFVMNLFCR